MQFEYSEPQNELEKMIGGFFCINAFGPIENGDDAKFENLIDTHRPPSHMVVNIDSTGGDLETSIRIGRLIREYGLWTDVGKRFLDFESSESIISKRRSIAGRCMSAATMIYLGGRLRHFRQDSKFGVHRFSFRNPIPDNLGQSQVLSAKIASYVSDMGISAKFLELSSATDATEIELVEESQLKELGVITGGMTDVLWSVQARGKMIYVRGERDSIFGRHKVMLCFVKDAGFMFWAVIEAQNRFDELLGFELVEIVINDEDVKIDISHDCNRLRFGTDVHVLARITNEQAFLISKADSFGIHVKAGRDAPMFLGVSAMSTDGGTEQLETLYYSFS